MVQESLKKYAFVAVIAIFIYLCFLVLRPFLTTIFLGMVLVYIFYPLYRWLNNKLKRKNVSALILTVFLILLVTVPTIVLLHLMGQQARFVYTTLHDKLKDVNSNPYFTSYKEKASSSLIWKYLNPDALLRQATSSVTGYIHSTVFLLPGKLIDVVIMLFLLFFLFRDGDQLLLYVRSISTMKKDHHQQILTKISDILHAVVFGTVVVSLIEGIIIAAGFAFIGYFVEGGGSCGFLCSTSTFFGVIAVIFGILPVIGSSLLYLPLGLYEISIGEVGVGIAIIIYGFLLVSVLMETIVKPIVIGERAKVHPLVIVIGVFGGLKMFGLIGIFLGPVILAVGVTLLNIYLKRDSHEI
ncbi:AI-2E family transporter [Candidatus Woesearchaeota archaeon]|nr:AI-2E family transporter [Candidatus Woesearchaeota archaeon]